MNFQDEQYDSEWYKRDKYEEESEVYRSEEHTSELQSPCNLVCRLLLEKKKILVLPFSWILLTSIMPDTEINRNPPTLCPTHLNMRRYTLVLPSSTLPSPFLHTLRVTCP